MPKNKAFKQIERDLKQKKKDKGKLKTEDQAAYVDSYRNIAVTLHSKELSKSLKYFEKDGVTYSLFTEQNISKCSLGFGRSQ